MTCSNPDKTAEDISVFLMETYGPLLGHQALTKILGFASADAFERSVQRGYVTLKLVRLPGRRGLFALAPDVARYIVEVSGGEAVHPTVRSGRTTDEPTD